MAEQYNFHEEEILGKAYDSKLMKRLLRYARNYWKYFAFAVIMLFFSTGFSLARPYILKVIIDDYLMGYAKPMMAYELNSGEKGIVYEGYIYQRIDGEISEDKLAGENIYSIIYYRKVPYLIKGIMKEKDEGNITVREHKTQDNFNYIISVNGTEYPAAMLSDEDIKLFRNVDISAINKLGILIISMVILAFVCDYLQVYALSYAGQTIIYNIRRETFNHLQKMSVSFFDRNPVGRLVTRVTNDTEALNEMYTSVLTTLLKDIIMLAGIIAIMFRMNVRLTLISLVTIPLVVLATAFFRKKARQVYRNVRTALAAINAALSENISGMRVIQIFNVEKENYAEFEETNRKYLKAGMNEIVTFGIYRPVIEMLSAIATAILIWFGGLSALSGLVELGVLYAFANYIGLMFSPINDIAEKYNILQTAMASSERIFALLDTETEIDDGEFNPEKEFFEGDIEFKNVWFSYNGDEWVLKDVSFKVPAGSTVAIVGATGSGKTTITNLINRMYEIQQGEILINGVNIKKIKKESLRRNIGVVLQDVFIFSGTVKENINLNEDSISDEEIIQAAHNVNADHFINNLEKGYDHEVSERGSTFSSGQRQLLAFARALAFNPSILILDEATANIDTETEALIQQALTQLTKNRTNIIIAHRLSTIQHADNIIVLHKGSIKEEGTHEELLQKKGYYYDLYKLQYDKAIS